MFSQGCIDTPMDNKTLTGVIQIIGWYLDRLGVLEIQVYANDEFIGVANYGDPRPALIDLFPEYNNMYAGFHYTWNTFSLDDGEYVLTVKTINTNKDTFTIGQRKVVIANHSLEKDGLVKKHILVACFPKSGSTYLTNILMNLTGFKFSPLVYAYGQNEQDLYAPSLLDNRYFDSVTQQHLRATTTNIKLLNDFGICPVILLRNIFDVAISYYDHLSQESLEVPTCYLNEKYFELTKEKQMDLIIELVIPWYFNFYVSWYDATKTKKLPTLWITYEDFISRKLNVLKEISDFYELDKRNSEIENAIEMADNKKNRFNKGIVGRGESFLTDLQKQKIVNYTDFYPWVDFSVIGI